MRVSNLEIRFWQIANRKPPEYAITGLGEGTILATLEVAKQLQLASQAGRLFPYQVVNWVKGTHPETDGLCVLLTIKKTFDTKMWGFD